jgi:hypothetical protein
LASVPWAVIVDTPPVGNSAFEEDGITRLEGHVFRIVCGVGVAGGVFPRGGLGAGVGVGTGVKVHVVGGTRPEGGSPEERPEKSDNEAVYLGCRCGFHGFAPWRRRPGRHWGCPSGP